ncbi:alpha/beta fold hydrolase [Dyadobacter sediminis]|uniref:Alpha/beta hydrolase n=1 Tax=Dyadobacter sediminis TaxID=1493691 RepID=A0A5R9KCF8_9BACT|nr:alpha/beta hydrolase [Dyadobacter sediminis]TLU92419.1 alpha/beta hydrolase [Dyadobacter sediminis]GGB94606.1 alpha/beta hydrolase [Dyadobacter sediminis]
MSNKGKNGKLKSESLMIGGTEQWIHYNDSRLHEPLILFLHGGPGVVQVPMLTRYCQSLYEHFLLVHWDQRGAGRSYHFLDKTDLTVQILVNDGIELSRVLCQKFNKRKVILLGHSWGTALGVLMCKVAPGLFHKYIGIGQVGNWLKGEHISYHFTCDQAIRRKKSVALKLLEKIGPPPYKNIVELLIQRTLLIRFGGGMYSGKSALNMIPEYVLWGKSSFLRIPQVTAGSWYSTASLWEQCLAIDLNLLAPELQVPVCFITGRHDYQIPFACAEEYFHNLVAPEKSWYWFENSAHTPFIEETEKFNKLIVNEILSDKIHFL